MAEQLTLTDPETFPPITTWRIVHLAIDLEAPSIKVTQRSDIGTDDVWRLVVSETVTAQQITNAIKFINAGKFMTQQSKTLQKWLLEQIALLDDKPGTVTGTPEAE